MSLSRNELVCQFPPGSNCQRLVKYYLQDAVKKLKEHDATLTQQRVNKIQKTRIAMFQNQLRECSPLVAPLNGRSVKTYQTPVKLGTTFISFIHDILSIYGKYVEDETKIKNTKQQFLKAYALYHHAPKDKVAREAFINAIGELCKELDRILPLSKEIRDEFHHWVALIEKNIDILDISHHELEAVLHGQVDKGTWLAPQECLKSIHRLSQMVVQLVDEVEEQVTDLLSETSPDSIAISWSVSDDQYELFRKQQMSGMNCDAVCDFMIFKDLHFVKNKTYIMGCLPRASQLKRLLNEYCEVIRAASKEMHASSDPDALVRLCNDMNQAALALITSTSESKKDRYKQAFETASTNLESLKEMEREFKEEFKKIKKPSSAQIKIQQERMNFIEKRIAAAQLMHECCLIIDTFIVSTMVDLDRFAKGYKNQVLQEKVEEVVQQPLSASVKAKGKKGTAGKKAKNKKAKPKHKAKRKPQKPKSKVAEKKKPMAETAIKVPIKEVEQVEIDPPLPLNTRKVVVLSGENTDVLHRNLWHQFALTLPSLLENSRPTASRVRLCATVLHGWMEKTLQTAAEKEGVVELSHNLWTYQQSLQNLPRLSIIRDLHKAIHWTRYGREWNEEWNNWTTLPQRPEVLKWMDDRYDGSNQKAFSKRVVEWIDQGEKIHDAYFEAELQEAELIEYPQIEDLESPHLDKLLKGVNNLEAKTVWIKQWQDDLEDLQEAIKMLAGEITPEQLPLVIEHIFMLSVGVIQSPLYAKQQENNGSHSLQHDLVNLMKTTGIALSQENEDRLKDDLDGIAHLHRYPFTGGVQSKAHRLYLNAIAIACNPTIGDGFEMQVKEGTKEGEIVNGVPYLKEYLSADDLRKSVVSLVESVVEEFGQSLLKSIKEMRSKCLVSIHPFLIIRSIRRSLKKDRLKESGRLRFLYRKDPLKC